MPAYSHKHKAVIRKDKSIHQHTQFDSFFLNSISFGCGTGREQACLVLCIVLFSYLMSCHRVKVSHWLGRGSSHRRHWELIFWMQTSKLLFMAQVWISHFLILWLSPSRVPLHCRSPPTHSPSVGPPSTDSSEQEYFCHSSLSKPSLVAIKRAVYFHKPLTPPAESNIGMHRMLTNHVASETVSVTVAWKHPPTTTLLLQPISCGIYRLVFPTPFRSSKHKCTPPDICGEQLVCSGGGSSSSR